ncbi:MAG: hypothetical protein ACI9M9_000467 [Flavobacteriaceae bacterium]|jgi:hypothetical protein
MRILSRITIITLLFFSACKSKGVTVSDTTCTSCEDAIIRYYGDPASDGCGWIVDASSIIFMPENLQPEFYIDSLKVRIRYNVLERVNCGLLKDAYPSIFIVEIQNK